MASFFRPSFKNVVFESASGNMSLAYWSFRRAMLGLATVLFGLRVYGREKVPRSGPVILAVNHHHYIDPFVVSAVIPRRILWMAKKETFRYPLPILTFWGWFPVDRQYGSNALRNSLGYLREEAVVGIFPEGTRKKNKVETSQRGQDAKLGVVWLASKSRAPIIPIYVSKIPSIVGRLRGKRLTVHVGDSLMVNSSGSKESYREACNWMMKVIYSLPRRV